MAEVKKTAEDTFYIVYDRYIADLHNQKSPKESFQKALHEYSNQVNAEILEALNKIANPIFYLQEEANKIGAQLNGMMTIQLSKDPEYLRGIALNALLKYDQQSNAPVDYNTLKL